MDKDEKEWANKIKCFHRFIETMRRLKLLDLKKWPFMRWVDVSSTLAVAGNAVERLCLGLAYCEPRFLRLVA